MKKTMLYCGMADDISTTFLLPIEWNTLYVMDKFDSAYSSDFTLEGQKKDILRQLVKGHDKDSEQLIYLQKLLSKQPNDFRLKDLINEYDLTFTPCIILKEEEINNRWHIQVEQNNKKKDIIIFHDFNFCKSWPEEIKDIDYLTSFGATFPLNNNEILNSMIEKRCMSDCVYYFKDHNLNGNLKAKHLFNQINIPFKKILSCPLFSHMPLLKYLFVDDLSKHDIFKIPHDLILSYGSLTKVLPKKQKTLK